MVSAKGRGGSAPGGVSAPGAHEGDGPVTWETLDIPCSEPPANRGAGDQSPGGSARLDAHVPGKEVASKAR